MLKADEKWIDEEISKALDVGLATPGRIRKKYVEEGLACTLNDKTRCREYEPKIDGKTEAHLIALVCGEPPEGYAHWSLRLLAAELVKLEQVELETVSHETVRQVLKKTTLNRGSNNNGSSLPRPMLSLSAPWKMCWICIMKPMILYDRWSVLMKATNN